MTDKTFMRADEVAEELDVSKAYAYKIIRQLNDELSAKGFITVAGRVSRQYFSERIYGAESPMVLSQGGERRKKEENRVKRPV